MRFRAFALRVKRGLDLAFAILALALLSPFLALIAGAILVTMGRPILFRQDRPGYKCRPFTILKFRTMRHPRPGEGDQPEKDSARLTRLGRLLRTFSLDELPQLWNILRGEMSLVGPRPQLLKYLDRYTEEEKRRHDMLPGLTGWAQVNGRNGITWEERLALDLWYVEHWSLWLDCKILLKTIPIVLLARGIQAPGQATMTEFRPEAAAGQPGSFRRLSGDVEVTPQVRSAPERQPAGPAPEVVPARAEEPARQDTPARRSAASF